jgi:insulysin
MSFDVVIQGEKHPAYLESRIESFFEHMETTMSEMKQKEFRKYVKSLKVILSEKPKTLNDRFNLLESEIICRTYEFDAEKKILEELDKITLEEVQTYYREWIAPASANRKKLSVHVISIAEGGAGSSEVPDEGFAKPINQELITDIESWKSNHGYYPAPASCMGIPPWKTRTSLLQNRKKNNYI